MPGNPILEPHFYNSCKFLKMWYNTARYFICIIKIEKEGFYED